MTSNPWFLFDAVTVLFWVVFAVMFLCAGVKFAAQCKIENLDSNDSQH